MVGLFLVQFLKIIACVLALMATKVWIAILESLVNSDLITSSVKTEEKLLERYYKTIVNVPVLTVMKVQIVRLYLLALHRIFNVRIMVCQMEKLQITIVHVIASRIIREIYVNPKFHVHMEAMVNNVKMDLQLVIL